MPSLPTSDEGHKIPSGFWKIVALNDSGKLKVAAFIMNQDAESTSIIGYVVTVREVESRSHLDFFWQLPQRDQENLETIKNEPWVQAWPK